MDSGNTYARKLLKQFEFSVLRARSTGGYGLVMLYKRIGIYPKLFSNAYNASPIY
ncbi:MAG: hypothetical protein RMI79_06085 [Nitrososphaerota archaeon]|nr:hypothetical protein [Nitrososphaerota archaeon]